MGVLFVTRYLVVGTQPTFRVPCCIWLVVVLLYVAIDGVPYLLHFYLLPKVPSKANELVEHYFVRAKLPET